MNSKLLYKREILTHIVSLQRLRVVFLLLKVYKNNQRLNILVVRIEFIFETFKMLTLESEFILYKNNNYV